MKCSLHNKHQYCNQIIHSHVCSLLPYPLALYKVDCFGQGFLYLSNIGNINPAGNR